MSAGHQDVMGWRRAAALAAALALLTTWPSWGQASEPPEPAAAATPTASRGDPESNSPALGARPGGDPQLLMVALGVAGFAIVLAVGALLMLWSTRRRVAALQELMRHGGDVPQNGGGGASPDLSRLAKKFEEIDRKYRHASERADEQRNLIADLKMALDELSERVGGGGPAAVKFVGSGDGFKAPAHEKLIQHGSGEMPPQPSWHRSPAVSSPVAPLAESDLLHLNLQFGDETAPDPANVATRASADPAPAARSAPVSPRKAAAATNMLGPLDAEANLLAAKSGPPLTLLRAIQEVASDVLAEGAATDAISMSVAVRAQLSPELRTLYDKQMFVVRPHSSSSEMLTDFDRADFLSATAQSSGQGWLLPNPRVSHAHTHYRYFEGDPAGWPQFAEPATCHVDGSGRATIVKKGRL